MRARESAEVLTGSDVVQSGFWRNKQIQLYIFKDFMPIILLSHGGEYESAVSNFRA
jgi:hypothetical protein